MRPQFHFLPAANWMNDPNGPIYFNGHYHMFCQYNPHAAVWGDMSWAHAVSPDMIHWIHLPVAMTPTPGSPDAYGVFTGSCLAVGDRVYAVYTGTVESTPEKATIRDGPKKIRESQCLAYSDDPQLIRWTKLPQPIVPDPPPGMKVAGFRDPSAWKQGEWYYMTVGSGTADRGGCVLLYRSRDFKSWTYLHKLTEGTWSGKPGSASDPVGSGEMWECPDFFPLDGGHVLIYSTQGKVLWQSGRLDVETMLFHQAKTGQLDLGAYYAPKTQLDAKGQRILWGWIPERRPEVEYREGGWAGMMSLPRRLRLDTEGTLRMETISSLASLRSEPLTSENSSAGAKYTLREANGEVFCAGVASEKFELVFSNVLNGAELMRIAYLPEKHAFTADTVEYPLDRGDLPEVHAFVDGSVIEVILSSRVGYTKRFYYKQSAAPDIAVEIQGSIAKSSAWGVISISKNRLTTPARAI